jgi:hypothetical protein
MQLKEGDVNGKGSANEHDTILIQAWADKRLMERD